ncbi:tripartite motif-containing protein [Anaeramoeba flamelloides]|uniref:Tripartite motif-containing protein n=1 Tax=Anaeramoeba flamelloides TaxID=1746091 RepID=A0ABQ8XA88_9EUKA|nr:tripartite motif-containing protein [Anaeramoeba flamelloides]
MSKEQTYLSTLCENCICENKSTTAKVFCIDCSKTHPKFCAGCDEVIHSIGFNSKHRRYKIEEYAKVEHDSCCPDHPNKELEFYCQKCKILLCIECVLEKHSEHGPIEIDQALRKEFKYEKLEKSYLVMKNKLKEQTKNYQRLKKSKDSSTKRVRKRVIKSIEEKIEMVQKELESKKIELFEQVEKYLESKNQVISSYLQKVEVIQLALENCHKNLSLFLELEKSTNSIEMAKIALENTKILELIDKRSKEINFKKIGLIVSEDEQNDPKLYFSCVSEAIKDLNIFFTQMYQTIVTEKLKLKGPNMKVIKLEKPMVDENLGGIKKTNSVAYSITVWLKISHIENRWRSVFHNGHTNNERKPGVFITPNSTAIHFRQDTKNKKNEGIDLPTNHCPLDKWFFWAVTVNDRHAIHYINSEKVHEGHFSASPLEPTNHLYLVDPWYNTAEGISIGDMLWIPYPISTQYVESLFIKQQLNYL